MLNNLTEIRAFDKIKKETESKTPREEKHRLQHTKDGHADTVGKAVYQDNAWLMGKCVQHVAREGTSVRCGSKRNHAVHEVETDMEQESQEEDTKIVSINSVYINKKWSSIMAKLQMQVGKVSLEIPYKIDTGSEGNIMLLYIFQKLFVNIGEDQLKRLVKGNIKLKMYNGTHITQLGICMVQIKLKNITKRCAFFVVPGNRQALLGMVDPAVLSLINLNIDSIQTLAAECKTNRKHIPA